MRFLGRVSKVTERIVRRAGGLSILPIDTFTQKPARSAGGINTRLDYVRPMTIATN
jgi:hypothetical protein